MMKNNSLQVAMCPWYVSQRREQVGGPERRTDTRKKEIWQGMEKRGSSGVVGGGAGFESLELEGVQRSGWSPSEGN